MSTAPADELAALEDAFARAADDDIRRRLDALRASHPDDLTVQVAAARLRAFDGDEPGARAELERLADKKNSPLARAYLGALLSNSGEHKKAVSQLSAAIKRGAAVPAASFALGTSLLRLGRYKEALPHLEKAATAMPSSPAAYFHLGEGFERANDLERAARAYAHCVRNEPRYEGAFAALVSCYGRLGDLDAAARALGEGLVHVPDDVELRRLAVTLAAERGDTGEMKRALLAIPEDARNAEDLANLAMIVQSEGDFDEGEQLARAAVAKDPSLWRAHHLLGLALESRDPFPKAEVISAYEAAIAASDPAGEAGVRLGLAHLTGDDADPERALAVLTETNARSGGHPGAHLHIAIAHRMLGNDVDAKQAAEAVVNDPRAMDDEREQAQRLMTDEGS